MFVGYEEGCNSGKKLKKKKKRKGVRSTRSYEARGLKGGSTVTEEGKVHGLRKEKSGTKC